MGEIGTDEIVRQIVANAGDAILYTDREGAIRLWNAGAEAIFGYAAGEVIGRSLDVIIPEKLRGRHWDGYHRVMGGAPSRYAAGELLAVPALRKDGERISIEFSIVAIVGADGTPSGVAAIVRDVTARWKKEREAVRGKS
jgi:PAS domain S-box-containing protein